MPPTGFKSGRPVYNPVDRLTNGSTVNNRAVTYPYHGELTKVLCLCTRLLHDVTISTTKYGPMLRVGGEVLNLYTRRDDYSAVYHLNGQMVVCHISHELSRES